MRYSAFLIVASAVGCASAPKTFSRPAPADALACSLRAATDSAFTPQRGGVADGYLVLQRPRGYSATERAKEGTTRIATLGVKGVNRSTVDQLTVTGTSGQLRVTAASLDEGGKQKAPTGEAERVAQYVLNACAPQ